MIGLDTSMHTEGGVAQALKQSWRDKMTQIHRDYANRERRKVTLLLDWPGCFWALVTVLAFIGAHALVGLIT